MYRTQRYKIKIRKSKAFSALKERKRRITGIKTKKMKLQI
jgi:hypothetical protein